VGDIRYVILSDLHFGAANSLMTTLRNGGPSGEATTISTVDPATPSPIMVAVLAALRHLTGGQAVPPTLILAGDILDLALSPDAVAATTFGGFVDAAFGGDERTFAPAIYYLPGNHDHHLWESAREAQYIAYLHQLAASEVIEPPWHTTRLLPDRQPPWTASDLMSTLIQRRRGGGDVAVRVVYPNLALTSDDGRRCLVVSHGHFTEAISSLMSRLQELLFPDQVNPAERTSIATLELENFAWIDFFWSTLGRSGDVGVDVGLIYAELGNAPKLEALSDNLVRGLVAMGHAPAWLRPLETKVASALVRHEIRRLARSERGTPEVILTPKTRLGLRQYLEGVVHQQLVEEMGAVPAEVGFVFGHTHKPFVEDWSVAGYPGLVRIHNTGGWVVDTARPAVTQGGVAVLLDEDLNAASLQFYRQRSDGGTDPPRLLAPAGARPNPLQTSLAAAVDSNADVWRAVATASARLVPERHRAQELLLTSSAKRQRP
jgi:hypothetical protein